MAWLFLGSLFHYSFHSLKPVCMKTYSFENLDVWKNSRELVRQVYFLTKSYPAEEKFGVINQLRRAVTSITCNLAEGSARITGKEQARFTEIAFGSLMEVLNLLIASFDLEYIPLDTLTNFRPPIDKIGNQLNQLRITQLNKDK
jgi:four helix bundle protein